MGLSKAELEDLLDEYEQLVDNIREARTVREIRELIDGFEADEPESEED